MISLLVYMLVSAIILMILVATGLCKFEWTPGEVPGEETFKNGLTTILYIIAIILVWPIIVLILIINGRGRG